MSHKNNLVRIKEVHNALGLLQKDVVYVGGATVSLYADRTTEEVRPTDDVDILIELWSYKDYAALEEQLRQIFIAAKLEAFKSPSQQDNNNGLFSTDFEDIVFVLENRSTVWDEMDSAPNNVRAYLKDEFGRLPQKTVFEEWVDAHASYGSPPATYYIIAQLEEFVGTGLRSVPAVKE